MSMLFGMPMALIGLFMLYCSTVKRDFVVYRLLAALSRILWGDATHRFYQISGSLIMGLGVLWAAGVIW